MANLKPMLEDAAADCSPEWERALAALAADMRRRAVSHNTVSAYMNDCRQLARWASGHQTDPDAVDLKTLRRYVASLSERGQAPSTVARKLAASRALFRVLMQQGWIAQNPADLVTAPQASAHAPARAQARGGRAAAGPHRRDTPLQLRDRALLELAYSSGLRAEELVTLELGSLDFDSESVRVQGKGDKTRIVPRGRVRAGGDHALPAARAAGALQRAARQGGWGRFRPPAAVPIEDRTGA